MSVSSRVPRAWCGIVAGAANATSELKLVLRAPLHAARAGALVVSNGRVSVHLAVHVDDIIASVTSDLPSLTVEVAEAFWAIALSYMQLDAGLCDWLLDRPQGRIRDGLLQLERPEHDGEHV